MVVPSLEDMFEAMFGDLPDKEYNLMRELWKLRIKLSNTTGWFSRFKLKSSINELEKTTIDIVGNIAINELKGISK